uniref:Semaphorin-6D-like n=1 Tax=Sinocyclocheilus rhinocerous TaxID=307959 RepID=A0A673GSI1_9TELE
MAMVSLAWLLPLIATATPFPSDLQPISVLRLEDSHRYPSFQGLMFNNGTERLGLDYQRMIRIQHMLYIAARDHVFVVNLTSAVDKIIPQQILTWRSTDVSKCAVRGRNSVSISIRAERISDEERGHFYSATVTDFQASDAVIYRSLGGEGRPVLRTVKYDSKWLREPHFLHAVEYGNYVYFFFSEIAVEHTGAGKVVYSRVARVCKNDSGGSTRVLDRHWTSFLKARLNCSVPGDTFFYFDVLQSLTNVLQINQRPAVVGVFTTQINSIPGSAVCGFYLDDIERVFNGKFKEQKNSDSMWTPVPEEHVPKPRPGSCAGEGSASSYSSSVQFPDSVLSFIKTHPLMDESVPSINSQPYKLTQIVVDTAAGPHKNRSVVFLGSEDGRVLKILTGTQANSSRSSRLLEDLHVFSPTQCTGERTVLGLELDKEHHALFVAFSSCIIRVPLSRCARHTTCKRCCLHTHDPYCIWLRTGRCADVAPGFKAGFEQDIDGDQSHSFDTCTDQSVSVGVKQLPDAPGHYTLLGSCVLVAFVLGAVVSGLLVSCYCGQRSHQSQEPEASLSLNSLTDTKPEKNNLPSSQTYSSVKPHATEEEELVSNLPTPDSTPELPIKNLKALNSQWERSHTHSFTLQVFPTNQTRPSKHTPSESHDEDAFTHMQNLDLVSSSLHMPTSYYSCLKDMPETSAFPLQTLSERPDCSISSSQHHMLIKMLTNTRQHSFNQKSAQPGNIYEIHRPLIADGSCLTRQHSYSEPPLLQRAAIIRRTESLKPQIPPKPTNIPPKTLHLPSHAKHSY